MPEGAIYVGRPTKWGNPFIVHRITDKEWLDLGYRWYVDDGLDVKFFAERNRAAGYAVHVYTSDLMSGGLNDPWLIRDVPELRGHDLVCWCPLDQPCHADELLKIANGGAAWKPLPAKSWISCLTAACSGRSWNGPCQSPPVYRVGAEPKALYACGLHISWLLNRTLRVTESIRVKKVRQR